MTVYERIDASIGRLDTYREKVEAIIAFHEQGIPAVMLLDRIRDLESSESL